MTRLAIEEANALCVQAMTAIGHAPDDAVIIADHLIDCELRGLSFGGLARALSIADRVKQYGLSAKAISVVQETPISANVDGGDQVGYLVAQRVTDLAIGKARASGMAIVGANETWYTGMFSYYLEQVTKAGFVGMIAGSGAAFVAPAGGTEGRFGTNPIAFGFPTTGTPIIWDIGTSGIMLGEVILAMREGRQLNEGVAFDASGAPTGEPAAALGGGAVGVWGGHKGSGLAMVVQLLGMMCGAAAAPAGLRDCGFFMLVVNPALIDPTGDFADRAAAYADSMRATRPLDPAQPVRVPFERSAATRSERLASAFIDVSDAVVDALSAIANERR
ncbi:Ldh family oxidoreductase (plasmid) [Polymorphobacter sp. PAMC 29334]|uniref:Ldh family oxidoreductase n=1 Tax=Polymorphobacter sp. PAMC 29334 TaxID=2862331 RepID=UPI001C6648A9|nr:Ldh family oxidoreductase [Polymorphobacter sp. PAMC 29334]QYE33326.1 Ldh family oxidoreductase [Polymorphobacter sp. PAMC 29334]